MTSHAKTPAYNRFPLLVLGTLLVTHGALAADAQMQARNLLSPPVAVSHEAGPRTPRPASAGDAQQQAARLMMLKASPAPTGRDASAASRLAMTTGHVPATPRIGAQEWARQVLLGARTGGR